MKLTSKRLVLRNVREDDFPQYMPLFASDFVQRYNCFQHREEAQVREELRRDAADDGVLAVTLRESGALIGMIYIDPDSLRRNVNSIEVSYWLGEPYVRRGYMSEALGAVLTHLFTEGGYRSVTARAFACNPASLALLRKLGFTEEGRLREAIRTPGGLVCDDVLFSLRKDEFQQGATKLT